MIKDGDKFVSRDTSGTFVLSKGQWEEQRIVSLFQDARPVMKMSQDGVISFGDHLSPDEAGKQAFEVLMQEIKKHNDALSALKEQNRALREAIDWAYSGDGLDECAIMIDRMTWTFTKPTEPSHATQIGVRKVLDAIRQRASTKQEGGE